MMRHDLKKCLNDRKELQAVFAELGYQEKPDQYVMGQLMEFTRDVPDGTPPFRGALVSFEPRWSLVGGRRVLKNISFYFSPVSRVSGLELLAIDLTLPSFRAVAFEAGSKEAFPIMGRLSFVPSQDPSLLKKLTQRLGDLVHGSSRVAEQQRAERARLTAVPQLSPAQMKCLSHAMAKHLGVLTKPKMLGKPEETVNEHVLKVVGIPMAFQYTLGEGTDLFEEAIFHGVVDGYYPEWATEGDPLDLKEISFSFLLGSRLARFDLLTIDFQIVREGIYSKAIVLFNGEEKPLLGHLYFAYAA